MRHGHLITMTAETSQCFHYILIWIRNIRAQLFSFLGLVYREGLKFEVKMLHFFISEKNKVYSLKFLGSSLEEDHFKKLRFKGV